MSRRDRQRPRLSEEDVRLWSMVTERVTAEPVKPRVPHHEAIAVVRPPAAETRDSNGRVAGRQLVGERAAERGGKARGVGTEMATSAPVLRPASNIFTRRETRRLKAGHDEIDARIDLHGMREVEAHSALRGFVMAAVGRGYTTVLVITGKGGGPSTSRDATAPNWAAGDQPRGVLKRNVPRWLAEPDLAPFVVGHSPAHTRHGGEGAIYVRLRRRERAGR